MMHVRLPLLPGRSNLLLFARRQKRMHPGRLPDLQPMLTACLMQTHLLLHVEQPRIVLIPIRLPPLRRVETR